MPYSDVRKAHSLETLSIVIRCILSKNLTGWEVMEIFAGSVNQSDQIFMVSFSYIFHGVYLNSEAKSFTAMIDETIRDATAPSMNSPFQNEWHAYNLLASLRHQMIQLAIIFMCGIGQLSPGAYFLRRDLLPSITIVSCFLDETKESFSFLFHTVCKISRYRTFYLWGGAVACHTGRFSQVGCSKAQPLSSANQRS
jgi:hypothetical protein